MLASASGVEAWWTNLGATLMRLRVPDRDGVPGDVVLGFDDPEAYARPHPHLGCVVGRVANRIAGARFALDGRVVALPANDGRHHLHGGPGGFGRRPWEAEPFEEPGTRGLRFRRTSPDGEEGYPGALAVEVAVRLDAAGALRLDLRARSDAPTPVNLTHHPYWNLRDGGRSPVLDHRLRVHARRFAPVDAEGIPTGGTAPVDGTALDFRRARRLGDAIDAAPGARGGYDHPFAIDGPAGTLRPAARLEDPRSGRWMELWTTLPCLQLYSGNGLDGRVVGRGGVAYAPRSGVCLEAQGFPDAPNRPELPGVVLRPGEVLAETIEYRLGWA